MNGLTLRISKGGGRKPRNGAGFEPLEISSFVDESLLKKNILFKNFLQSSSADVQLAILKNILDEETEACSEETIKFLVIVFMHAESKHPVKCFLTRHITKHTAMQHIFSATLATYMNSLITQHHVDCTNYKTTVSNLPACVENFPAGVAAVRMVEMELVEYLKGCLECCVGAVRNTDITKALSPTEKNQIFNLSHLALRLLLYITQKISDDNINNLNSKFKDIRVLIKCFLFDEDVPMDTKSVCGILYLTMRLLEKGPDSWVDILTPKPNDDELHQLLSNEACRLAVYSAIATVVSMDRLQRETVDEQSAIVALTSNILSIGERGSSESTIVLGVTRTLLHISKASGSIADAAVGLVLVDRALVFAWAHLEHHMDSVRHLTAQILGCVVKYCAHLKRNGDDQALDNLFAALYHLDKSRKSYYVSLAALTAELGASTVMARLPTIIREVIDELDTQAVQASATTALEILLQKHVQESDTGTIYRAWIEPILSHVATNTLDSGVLNILESLLVRTVKLNGNVMDYILPHIKQSCDSHDQAQDLKCILMLLNVIRKSGVAPRPGSHGGGEWKGIISYQVLRMAAVDAVEETRTLSLSLVVESPRSTEPLSPADLGLVLHYMKYNINAQSPNFRQLTLSMMKKFLKRLEDSYRVIKRQKNQADYYEVFLEDLRALCFCSLVPGANYSRRVVALQVLAWCEQLQFEGYHRVWKEDYVEKLLLHLEDSYENNKAFALDVLEKCPVDLLKYKKYTISLRIEDVLRQASSLKPTDCTSAAYKLNLLRTKLHDYVLEGSTSNPPEGATYALLQRLLVALRAELATCARSVVSAAARAPMYGVLHCMGHLVTRVDVDAISNDERWTSLVSAIIVTCIEVNSAVAGVVNNSSPEGHLPMDMTGVGVHHHDNLDCVTLDDGRQVTAQMVLVCAWRSVKEVSLLLGELTSRLTVSDEAGPRGTLAAHQLEAVGDHFTQLLAETKHRGAFEQAYVGFTKLLARLWRCRNPALHALPRAWLSALLADLATGGGGRRGISATRRSAGLPFMIQALVTTELQVLGNPKCFHSCMSTLLRVARARAPTATVETRAHCINTVRALYRNSALDESVAPYVGEGLMVALEGFEGDTWMERNSSTLLFSALMVRVFGVQRSRDTERLCTRNRMTGRIFFLRYPDLYDYMLDKLQAASRCDGEHVLRPSLYPVLLLLARLYPSSLEGTVSNLKLVSFVPHVVSCAGSGVLKTRQLAARAVVPLIAPEQYITHLEAMFAEICDRDIKRNYCHGILLQLVRLLDARPEALVMDQEAAARLRELVVGTLWAVEQVAGVRPCYLLADEYVKVVNLIVWRFPNIINQDVINKIVICLEQLLFANKEVPLINSGRDICLANALYLYLVVLNKYGTTENICELIYRSLAHKSYEVVLTVLNYLLILYGNIEEENKFQEHLSKISNTEVLKKLRGNQIYIESLCNVLKNEKYLECRQKALKVLTMEDNTEQYVVEVTTTNIKTDEIIIDTLFDHITNQHENLTHVYLQCLSNFVTKKVQAKNVCVKTILNVLWVLFACSSSDNSEETRTVVVEFMERNFDKLLKLDLNGLNEGDQFEYKATLVVTVVRLLEDDSSALRQRVSAVITKSLRPACCHVISSRAGEVLVEWVGSEEREVLVVLALVDFRSEVCLTDEGNDEPRVFDHNERYNIHLEETMWTNQCANKTIQVCNETGAHPLQFVRGVVNNEMYRGAFEKLCNHNFSFVENSLKDGRGEIVNNNVIHPKVNIFIDRLCNL